MSASSDKAIRFLNDDKMGLKTGRIVIRTGLSLKFSFKELDKTTVGKCLWR